MLSLNEKWSEVQLLPAFTLHADCLYFIFERKFYAPCKHVKIYARLEINPNRFVLFVVVNYKKVERMKTVNRHRADLNH